MDIDAFAAVHGSQWQRMEELCKRGRLDGAEADELVQLYQRLATQLSQVRTSAPDPSLVSHLSRLLAQARAKIAGAHDPTWKHVVRFFQAVLPIALYRIRWWAVGVTVGALAIATIAGVWAATNPDVLGSVMTPSEQDQYVQESFAAYYSENPAPSFAAQVWTNNAWIAAQCIGGGITGIFPLYVLFSNSVNVGMAGGLMAAHDASDVFFGLILPHGMLELSAVFVAGAAGIKLFWTVAVPGPRTRLRALAEEGRATITIAIGLALALAVSGLIEGFVTPADIPVWVKMAIGGTACAAFWFYIFYPARRALAAGETADLAEGEAESTIAVAG